MGKQARLKRQRKEEARRTDDPQNYLSRRNRVWFVTASKIDPDRIVDIGDLYREEGHPIGPWGQLIHTNRPTTPERIRAEAQRRIELPSDSPEKVDSLVELVVSNAEKDSFHLSYLIPTELLPSDWIFNLTRDNPTQLRKELHALSLLIILGIRHDGSSTDDIVGTGQPIHALSSHLGFCFDRASLLCAILRYNDVPARIVGNLNFNQDAPQGSRGHWWVEVFVDGRWYGLETNIRPTVADRYLSNFTLSPDRSFLVQFLELASEINSSLRGSSFGLIDNPMFTASVLDRRVALEIAVPEGYPR